MKTSFLKFFALFNLLLSLSILGAGWLNDTSFYRGAENLFYQSLLALKGPYNSSQIFSAPIERVKYICEAPKTEPDSSGSAQTTPSEELHAFTWELTPYIPAPLPRIATVEVGDDPEKIFLEYPLLPMDYAVIFYQIGQLKARNIVSTVPLSWPPPQDDMEIEALSHEISQYDQAFLGLVLTPSARKAPLPSYFKPLVLNPEQIEGNIASLPSVGRVIEETQIKSSPALCLAPQRIETEAETLLTEQGRKVTLFVRWQNYVLPTLPLLASLDALKLTLKDIKVEFGKTLHLGQKRKIPIDEAGAILLKEEDSRGVSSISATRLMPDIDAEGYKKIADFMMEADIVLLGEGKTPLKELGLGAPARAWDWSNSFDVATATVQTLLGAEMPAETIKLVRLSRLTQFSLLIVSLILFTWALSLAPTLRVLILSATTLGLILTSGLLALFSGLWFSLAAPLVGLGLTLVLWVSVFRSPPKAPSPTETEESTPATEEELPPVFPPQKIEEKKAPQEPAKKISKPHKKKAK